MLLAVFGKWFQLGFDFVVTSFKRMTRLGVRFFEKLKLEIMFAWFRKSKTKLENVK